MASEELSTTRRKAFRPKARLLQLLGDQLIRSPGIAAFELAKNAYDADARWFRLVIEPSTAAGGGKIVAQDNGSGMTWETVTGVWLEPGSDNREQERLLRVRTPRFHRLPMGEKGIGRFAAHKLGSSIRLITRAKGQHEVTLTINWDKIASSGDYLDEHRVLVRRRAPIVFKGKRTGTRIIIRGLRENWTRGAVRELARSLSSIQSPFETKGSFRTSLEVPSHPDWLAGLLTVETLKAEAAFEAHGVIQGDKFSYTYQFRPGKRSKVPPRSVTREVRIETPRDQKKESESAPLNLSKFAIGPVSVDLFMYDLDPTSLSGITDRKGLKDFLKLNGGVRVYRDGVRVFDYAEPGNDWLNLEGRRINNPTAKLSNNLVLGAVALDREMSENLIEKTNREGFVENDAYHELRLSVQSAITHVEAERAADKARMRLAGPSGRRVEPVVADVEEIRQFAQARGYLKEIGPILDRIEKDYREVRDVFLVSASAGLSLTVVIHEVEKGLAELKYAVQLDASTSQRIRDIASRLARLIEGLGAIARSSGMKFESAADLLSQAVFNSELRLKAHGVTLVEAAFRDFRFKGSRRLIVSTLMNLIDNSIWWLDSYPAGKKTITLRLSNDFSEGPSIVAADNNTLGFIDSAEILTQPFFTRKPDGMGLGLHLASEVMRVHGGQLIIADAEDVGLDPSFRAVVALVFPEAKWVD